MCSYVFESITGVGIRLVTALEWTSVWFLSCKNNNKRGYLYIDLAKPKPKPTHNVYLTKGIRFMDNKVALSNN